MHMKKIVEEFSIRPTILKLFGEKYLRDGE